MQGPPFVFVGSACPPGVQNCYPNSTTDSTNGTAGKYYWGYCIDLIFEIQKKMKFEFTLYESPDKNYGSIQPNGTWDGLVNELIMDVSGTIIY